MTFDVGARRRTLGIPGSDAGWHLVRPVRVTREGFTGRSLFTAD